MKNKKLIATVASLCLVLVAVVAAVIGVLAAAQQSVVNKVKVNYYAVANVYATVSLNGKTEQTEYGAEVEKGFTSAQQKTEEDLVFSYTTGLGLSESAAGLTNKYALYRFTFNNENPTHALDVTMTYKENTAGTNVRLFWVASDSAAFAPELHYTNAGELKEGEPTETWKLASISNITLDGTGSAKVYHHLNGTPNPIAKNGTGDTQYIYLVVAVVDLNTDAGYDLDNSSNKLTFTLDGYRAPAPANP